MYTHTITWFLVSLFCSLQEFYHKEVISRLMGRPATISMLNQMSDADFQAILKFAEEKTADMFLKEKKVRADRQQRNVTKRACSNCGTVETMRGDLKSCAACHSVCYCNATCQKMDWKKKHKKNCKRLKKMFKRKKKQRK